MLFGLSVVELAILIAVGCLLEVVLLWAATGLVEAPETSWIKLSAIALGVFLLCFAAAAGIAFGFGVLNNPLAPEQRTAALAALGTILGVSLVAPAFIYPTAFAIDVRRGIWVSVLQWLLRGFLYILILALVMVFLAVLQILRGPSGS
jgi:hypothetical protein